jgi:VRR-NUC domain
MRGPTESEIQSSIILNLSHADIRLFRMQVGNFELIDGRRIVCGIKGMSDLIGYRSITVTPEMVGTKIAVYAAVEVKSSQGRFRDGQLEFLDMVRAAGGIAGVARSLHDARSILYESTQ